jgi:hypothetical protein
MTAALTAETPASRDHQGQKLRTLRGKAQWNTDTSDVAGMPRSCVRGGIDHYAHVLNQQKLIKLS